MGAVLQVHGAGQHPGIAVLYRFPVRTVPVKNDYDGIPKFVPEIEKIS